MSTNRKVLNKSKSEMTNIRIKNASDCDDPLKEIRVEQFKIDNQQIISNSYKSSELTTDQFDWMLQLTEYNMKKLYEQSNWGWH